MHCFLREREIDWLPPMCPDRESNPQSFSSQDDAPTSQAMQAREGGS